MKKIDLKKEDISYLNTFLKKGDNKARALTRARILLLLHKKMKDVEIQDILGNGRSTIWRVKNNYIDKGIEYALTERDRPGQPMKYDNKKKVEIIAFTCTKPPKGRKRWTVRLIAEKMKKQKGFETINRESIRLILKKTIPNHG